MAMNLRVRGTGVAAAVLATGLAGFSPTGCNPSQPAPSALTSPTPSGPELDAGLSTPVPDPLYPRYGNPALDVLHYKLVLSWSPPRKELTGTATLTIRATRPLPEIALDFSDAYTVDEASVDGTAATPTRRGNDLVVRAPRPLATNDRTSLIVRYHGTHRSDAIRARRFPGGPGSAGRGRRRGLDHAGAVRRLHLVPGQRPTVR